MRFIRPALAETKIANWYIGKFYRDIVRVLEAHAGLHKNSVVIEFGCDIGLLACHLKDRCRLILVDLSDERKTVQSLQCEFHRGRAEETELPDSSADIIVMISVYHHLLDFDEFNEESTRILRPHGFLVLVEPVKTHPITMFLNILSKFVHARDSNLSEPYGLALWINDKFLKRKLCQSYDLVFMAKVDNFLWGINAFIPQVVLKAYYRVQQIMSMGNTKIYVFQKRLS